MSNPTVVLVHGGFVDGSGWRGVHDMLTGDGYNAVIVQNPTLTLDGDVKATHWVLDNIEGPAVLVGHSYGGAVITEAGRHAAVEALVYITAFAPDTGESVLSLVSNPAPGAPVPPILPPRDGYLLLDPSRFHASFAGDLTAAEGRFLADAQVPWGVDAASGPITEPAWRSKPCWYLVATDDLMIPPDVQRTMAQRASATISEAAGSHAIYVSRPDVVAETIRSAVKAIAS